MNSSVHSPAASTVVCSPGPPNMYTVGPYAHETQLVSPPVFSTFTTEPSTAAVTPPPELAHLTTPSSPDVPFAQYIASSLEAKAKARDAISPLSTSGLASPCDTPASYSGMSAHLYITSRMRETISPRSNSSLASPCDTPACYTPTSGHRHPVILTQETILSHSIAMLSSSYEIPGSYSSNPSPHYLGSPVGCLVSSSMGKEKTFSSGLSTTTKHSSSFPSFDPFFSPDLSHTPFASLIVPCDSSAEDTSTSLIGEPSKFEETPKLVHPKDASVTVLSYVQHSEPNGDHCELSEELHQRCLQAMGTVNVSSEASNGVHNFMHDQIDVELSALNIKQKEGFTERVEMNSCSPSRYCSRIPDGLHSQIELGLSTSSRKENGTAGGEGEMLEKSSDDLDEKIGYSPSANRIHRDQNAQCDNNITFKV
ncbi:hypothetical protein KP509_24G040300 [Ceratopteris richardii]|nr:hypothetical protein KP509_24G040300 [Ceratopteris richardii]